MDELDGPEGEDGQRSVDALAARFLAARDEGAEPDAERWAARLTDARERDEFLQLVGDAGWALGLLPSQVRPGVLLNGRYRLLGEIGAGGMGKVFEAVDLQLERTVAVKVLATFGTGAFDPEHLFAKESRLLASLQHPNIVAIHEAGYEGDVQYLVMDRVHGRSLTDVLDAVRTDLDVDGLVPRAPKRGEALERALGRPVPEGRTSLIEERSWWRSAARVMVEIANTLQAAHGAGVVHRDVKPANILLRGDGSPVVLDFGLAGSLDQAENVITRGLVGSVAYVAPEQALLGEVGNDPRTDIYQLGLILYELLTLRRAFPDGSMTVLLERITRGDFTRPRAIDASIPAELEAICLKATELDPSRRYATARELSEDLQRYLDGIEVPHAARGGRVTYALRGMRYFARRRRMTLVGAAAAVLVALAWWVAPEKVVSASLVTPRHWRFADDDTRVLQSPGTAVRMGDVLGVSITGDTPLHVYAISVFGSMDDPEYMLPMPPETLIDETGDPGANAGDPSWDVVVDPRRGPVNVACTRIDTTRADILCEGLWVFTSREPQPRIVAWLEQLALESERLGPGVPGIPMERALALLGGGASRGGRLDASAEARDATTRWLSAEALQRTEAWPYDDPQRSIFYFAVELP